MRISTRLGLGFAVLVCFLLVNSCVGWMALSGSKQQTNQIVEVNNQKIALAYELQGDLNEIARAIRNYILYTDKGLRDTMASRMAKNRQKFEQDLERIRSLMHTAAGQQFHDEVAAGKTAVFPLYDNVVSLVNDGKSEDAAAFLAKSVQPQQDKLFGSIRTLLDRQVQLNGEAVAKLDADYALTVKIMAATAVGSIVLGLILALRITRSITGPLDRAVTLANAVAEGGSDAPHRGARHGRDRRAAACLGRDDREPDGHRRPRAQRHAEHCLRHQPDRRRQPGPVFADGAAGEFAGGNGLQHGGVDLHREAERGERAAGQ